MHLQNKSQDNMGMNIEIMNFDKFSWALFIHDNLSDMKMNINQY